MDATGGRRRADADWLPFPWFVAALATLLWWPLGTYWQSDDWIALSYARETQHALADLTGNQYGLPGIVQFWRPLVTFSFWLEQQLAGGPSPLLSHLTNAVSLGLSAMLLGRIVARFLGAALGLAAAAIHAFHPLHAGSVLWAVGRVDTFATFWILAACLAHLRWREQRARSRAVALACMLMALATKEVAVVLPGLLGLYELAAARRDGVRRTIAGIWPYAVLLVLYVLWRLWLFGGIGGYHGATPALLPSLGGLALWTARVLDPLLLVTDHPLAWLGLLPALIGLAGLVARAPARCVVALLLAYLVALLPMVQFWAHVDEPKNLRYWALPFTVLAVLLACGGRWNVVLVPLLFAWPHVAARQDHLEAGLDSERRHLALLREVATAEPGWHFVAGLPRTSPSGNVYQFHLGIDRLLPPSHRLFALRPLAPEPQGNHPAVAERGALPGASTWEFVAANDLRRRASPEGGFRVTWEGPDHLGRQALYDLRDRRITPKIRIEGEAGTHYRLTLFTAGGYLSTTAVAEAGVIDVRDWLEQARHASGGTEKLMLFPLSIAAALDRERTFPLLVETADGRSAGNLLAVTFDRDLHDMVNR